jgi:hypothetical protein
MAEPGSGTPVPARLQQLAQRLRQAHHLGPEERSALAELVEELSQALDPASLPEPARKHLEDNAAHLLQALQTPEQQGTLGAATKRLEEAALRLENEAPQVTGIVRRLIDALANLGI